MLAVDTKIRGLTKTIHRSISEISIGLTSSPIPPTLDALLNTQTGTSAPIFDIALGAVSYTHLTLPTILRV